MSLAILVINMPKACKDCYFCQSGSPCWCDLYVTDYREIENINIRQKWCPLKPLPNKRILPKEQVEGTNYGEEPWFSDGYNACLEEIIGEEEI